MESTDETNQKKRKYPSRPIKELPPELAGLRSKDADKFVIAIDRDISRNSSTFGKELLCAVAVELEQENGEKKVIDLKKLTSDQQKKIAANLNVKNCGSVSAFMIRHIIACTLNYRKTAQQEGIGFSNDEQTNTLFRMTNVIFSQPFDDELVKLNDNKTRKDFEGNTTYAHFWTRAADAHNAYDVEDPELDKVIYTSNVQEWNDQLKEIASDIDPRAVNVTTKDYLKANVRDLFKIRRRMKGNMTQSGTHDSNPWNFIDIALDLEKVSGITKDACFYFYLRCEEHADIDASFQPFMNSDLKGSSEDIGDAKEKEEPQSEKKRMATMLDEMAKQGSSFLDLFSKQTEVVTASATARARAAEMQARNTAFAQYWKMHDRLAAPSLNDAQRVFLTTEMEKLEDEFGFGKPKAKVGENENNETQEGE